MIKLLDLLLEIQNNPKAIFLAGSSGSGKSFLNKQLLPPNYITINSDNTYEELLQKSGIGLKQKDFTPEQLSQAAKLLSQSRKVTNDVLVKAMEGRKNLIIDGTGASSNTVLKKKKELESLGYNTFMLMVYVSPLTSLERNKNRDRSLMPSIVLRTWRDVTSNIEIYSKTFNNNFVLVDNDPKDSNKNFNVDLLSPYLDDSSAVGKKKSPEELKKSTLEKEEINKDIEKMIKQLPKLYSIELSKSKIKQFTK